MCNMSIRCKNCNNQFIGNFCSTCGQKATVKELTFHDMLHETWHSLTHTDSGILRLIKDLFLRPKTVYLNYFEGQRKKYFSPVTFFLITVAILLFVGTKIFDYEDYKLKTLNEFGRYAFQATKLKTLLLLPVEILLTWLFFNSRFNVAKNIVFWLYLNGFLFVIKILFTPFYISFISSKDILDAVLHLLQYLIIFIHLILVFGNNKWKNIVLLLVMILFLFIADYLVAGYLLFGEDIYKQTGTNNFLELVLRAFN